MLKFGFNIYIIVGAILTFSNYAIAGNLQGWKKMDIQQMFTYVASVLYNNGDPSNLGAYVHKCTGSVISTKHVLTAANCFDNLPKDIPLAIKLGELDVSGFLQFIIVDQLTIHPEYNRNNQRANIAILTLTVPITFPRTIIIRPARSNMKSSKEGILLGWNCRAKKPQNQPPRKLLKDRVSVLPTDECKNYYPNLAEDQFCITGMNSKNAPCNGTLGMPFRQTKPKTSYPILVGVATHWPKNCEGPALFTSLNKYQNFTYQFYQLQN